MKKVLIFDYKKSEKEFIENHPLDNMEIELFEEKLNEQTVKTLSKELKDKVEIISVFISSNLTKSVINEFKNLKIIATRSTGFNHIDLKECEEKQIAVVNVSKYGETTVAQYAFGLLITLIRQIVPAVLDMRHGKNKSDTYVGHDLNSLTVGVLGTGAIGAAFCKLVHGADMKILAYDFYPNEEYTKKYGVKYVDKEYLLQNADVVSLHVPYNKENHHFISENELNMMKKGAFLINTARGELVDTTALHNALVNEQIKGAALDVGECESFTFDMENLVEKMPSADKNCISRALVTKRLMELPNVLITPHIAYNTQEAVNKILQLTYNNILDFYNGGKTNRIV